MVSVSDVNMKSTAATVVKKSTAATVVKRRISGISRV